MDQPPAVASIAFADVWPRATRNGDRHRLMRHWRRRSLDFFLIFLLARDAATIQTKWFVAFLVSMVTLCLELIEMMEDI